MKCSNCEEEAPVDGMFKPCGVAAKTYPVMCFACVFIYTLKGSKCGFCGADTCGAIVVAQAQETDRLVPVACCPECLPTKVDGIDVLVDGQGGRLPIPEINSEQ